MTRQPIGPRAVRRLVRAWAEMDYAQRRLFEIRTGIPVTDSGKGPDTSAD